MRRTALAGLFACAVIIAANSSSAQAQELDLLKSSGLKSESPAYTLIASAKAMTDEANAETAAALEPEPAIHVVGEDETLSTIAEQHGTTWLRLYNKNTHIVHPDQLNVGEKVTVPLPDEQLTDRPLPQPPATEPELTGESVAQGNGSASASRLLRGSSAGNTYTAGYCTWYAKNMRPDLPNNLGNADTWVARAAAQGIPTGSAPRVGAIGQEKGIMHVVYVESVNGDGTVTVSEMNYEGLYVVSRRTVPASAFMYIY